MPWQANITKRATFTVFLTPDGSIRIAYEQADLLSGKACYMGIQGGEGEAIRLPTGDYAGKEVFFVPGVADEEPEPEPAPDPCPDCPECPECKPCPTCPKCGQPFDKCSKCEPCPPCAPCPPCPEPEPCPPCDPCPPCEIPACPQCGKPFSKCGTCDELIRVVVKEVEKRVEVPIVVKEERPVWAPWYWIKKAWEKVF